MNSFTQKKNKDDALQDLLAIMAALRAPDGCPWDREQSHRSLRFHAVEEVYELMDAIEAEDDHNLLEELGDVLLQVVFHCQIARERGAFDFQGVCRRLADKLVRRHPHVFGDANVKTVEAVWAQWDQIKHSEHANAGRARTSVLDGVPRHLPALMRAEKLVKKARKGGLLPKTKKGGSAAEKARLGAALFRLAKAAQGRGWSAEELLRQETRKHEKQWRKAEAKKKRRG